MSGQAYIASFRLITNLTQFYTVLRYLTIFFVVPEALWKLTACTKGIRNCIALDNTSGSFTILLNFGQLDHQKKLNK